MRRITSQRKRRSARMQTAPFSFSLNVLAVGGIGLAEREHRHEGFLRDLDATDHLHARFALFLFFEELALACDIAAVALGQSRSCASP